MWWHTTHHTTALAGDASNAHNHTYEAPLRVCGAPVHCTASSSIYSCDSRPRRSIENGNHRCPCVSPSLLDAFLRLLLLSTRRLHCTALPCSW